MRETVTINGRTNENTAEYESASTGEMRIMRQSTARVDPAGTRETTLYVPDPKGKLTLFSQQVIEKKRHSKRKVETTTVRYALSSDPGKLGPSEGRRGRLHGRLRKQINRGRSASASPGQITRRQSKRSTGLRTGCAPDQSFSL